MSTFEPFTTDPYTYTLPGMSAYPSDVLLSVFGKPIHVHSILLRIHSAFFRMNLDLPPTPQEQNGKYSYEYVTMVDEAGCTWTLEKIRSPPIDTLPRFNGDPKFERKAFFNLLQAIYGRCFSVDNTTEIILMVRLADIYYALPILSHLMTAILTEGSKGICQYNAFTFLVVARKIRNPLVFRECLVYLVARWDRTPFDIAAQNDLHARYPGLYNAVKRSHADVYTKIEDIETTAGEFVDKFRGETLTGKMLWESMQSANWENKGGDLCEHPHMIYEECVKLSIIKGDQLERVKFYRGLLRIIEPLLVKNLHFSRGYLPPNLCYCAEIKDEDLPWDVSQLDWW